MVAPRTLLPPAVEQWPVRVANRLEPLLGDLDVALTALERQGRTRLLSSPKVTTQNNKSAEIKQGVQIPIQTLANNTVSVQFKDAVLTLRVTPQITDAGTVILDLEVENNAPDYGRSVNGIPMPSALTSMIRSGRDATTFIIL